MPLIPSIEPEKRKKLLYGFGVSAVALLIVLGVFARNDWFPKTDGLSGKKTGWFGRELPANASSSWNPFAAPLPSGTPQLSKEYIYAGSRLLAVEDANAGGAPTPTPTPHGFEGDVAPRSLGDGVVVATDITIERNFAAGLAIPATNPNEFQRADAAPFSTLGNCVIDSADVVQVRRYVTGLDPLRPAGGPSAPCGNGAQYAGQTFGNTGIELDTATSSNREVRVGPTNGRRGETLTVPVFMKMDRDEMAVAFSLEYNAARLSNPRLTMNSALPASAVLTVNTTQAGKIGVLIDAEETLSSTPRELRIVFVTFDVLNSAVIGSTPINITDALAIRSVSDPRANLLVTSYSNGNVTITN